MNYQTTKKTRPNIIIKHPSEYRFIIKEISGEPKINKQNFDKLLKELSKKESEQKCKMYRMYLIEGNFWKISGNKEVEVPKSSMLQTFMISPSLFSKCKTSSDVEETLKYEIVKRQIKLRKCKNEDKIRQAYYSSKKNKDNLHMIHKMSNCL